jgi:hypothetical protein
MDEFALLLQRTRNMHCGTEAHQPGKALSGRFCSMAELAVSEHTTGVENFLNQARHKKVIVVEHEVVRFPPLL